MPPRKLPISRQMPKPRKVPKSRQMAMPRQPRKLPHLSPTQVVALQDALLANADRLLTAALAVLDQENVGLARSLAILGMEESGKAIAIHEPRGAIAYDPEGEPFVNPRLERLWASHTEKLALVHSFLVDERYWFGTEAADPEANAAFLGIIKRWTRRHDKLKQRGFYVDVDKAGQVLAPTGVADRESLIEVIAQVHQIGWRLRLGEHIEAKHQAEVAVDVPPWSEDEIEEMRDVFSDVSGLDNDWYESMRQGRSGRKLNNDGYRLHLSEPESNPFANFGAPGYEAETRELTWRSQELDEPDVP